MTAELARMAAELQFGPGARGVRLLASGRSCDAYLVSPNGVDGEQVVRVPVAGSGRSVRFRAEAALGALLAVRGRPVATWRVVDVQGVSCAVGPRLPGTPVPYGTPWTAEFTAQLGDLLAALYGLPAAGFGPLVDDPGALLGEAGSACDGVLRRWCWAPCWPFDGSDLADHPVSQLLPEVASAIGPLRRRLLDAAQGPLGVVHSDLHRQHLLVGQDGGLTGVLDFGDAFIGSVAWDFGLLRWYYGRDVAEAVARRHPDGQAGSELGSPLALAVGLYELAKTPMDLLVRRRLERVLRER